MQYRAVLFDFDFTLGDASEAIIAGFRHGFAALGYPVPDDNAVRRTIGTPLEDAFAQLTGCPDRAQGVRFHELFTEVAVPMQIQCTKLFPGAVELLTALKEAGVPAAIVSTKRGDTIQAIEQAEKKGMPYCTILFHDYQFDKRFDPQRKQWYEETVRWIEAQGYEFISYRDAIRELEEAI